MGEYVSKKRRKHHNNSGLCQIKRDKTDEQVKRIAKKLGIPTKKNDSSSIDKP